MKPKVIVVGGGISGLAAALRLHERGADVKLIEASHHLGGVIATSQKNGFLMEGGPDSFISIKPWGLDLCRRLGLEKELIGTDPDFRKSFVVRKGKLVVVPEGFYMMAPVRVLPFLGSELFSWPAKFRMAMDYFMPAKKNGGDESVANFIRRRFGVEALERVGQAMVAGVYSADPEKLSLKSTFPQFLDMEQKYGSVIRGLRKAGSKKASGPRYSLFLTLKNGMGSLVDAIVKRLPTNSIELDAPLREISKNPQTGKWNASYGRGHQVEADAVVLALSSPKIADFVQGFDGDLARELRQISYASIATINFGYRRSDICHPLDGFGFVVPTKENLSLIGCTFSSVKFSGRAPEGHALLRAFVDSGTRPEVVQKDLEQLLGITGTPVMIQEADYPASMPQYPVGHLEYVQKIESMAARHPGLCLAGNALHGIGLPDCVHQSEEIAEKIMV